MSKPSKIPIGFNRIVVDCDDVLLKWQEGFRTWLAEKLGIHVDPEGPKTWDLGNWIGQHALPLIRDFNSSDFFGRLEPSCDAVIFVNAIASQGQKLTVLTSCSDDSAVQNMRRTNLMRCFPGAIDRVICIALGASKRQYLDALPRGLWIEDNYHNALDGAELGFDTWCLRKSHNRSLETSSHPHVKWVDSLQQILSHYK